MPNKEFIPEPSQSMNEKGTESVNNNENGSADAANNEKEEAEVETLIEVIAEDIWKQNPNDPLEEAITESNQKLCKLLLLAIDLALEKSENKKEYNG
jgi:hypothetical protein